MQLITKIPLTWG